jgi:hypothetical protein
MQNGTNLLHYELHATVYRVSPSSGSREAILPAFVRASVCARSICLARVNTLLFFADKFLPTFCRGPEFWNGHIRAVRPVELPMRKNESRY